MVVAGSAMPEIRVGSGRDDKVVTVLVLILSGKRVPRGHNFVISTGAKRSGEIRGFLFRF